jgi:hypothetical protein
MFTPKCSAVYYNYPGMATEEPQELQNLIQEMRQVSEVEISITDAIGPNAGINGKFLTVYHDKGQDVFYEMWGPPYYYVNGECTMN